MPESHVFLLLKTFIMFPYEYQDDSYEDDFQNSGYPGMPTATVTADLPKMGLAPLIIAYLAVLELGLPRGL